MTGTSSGGMPRAIARAMHDVAAPETLIAQLSDPHIVANARLCLNIIDTSSFLREAVETVNRLNPQPDAVVISGDLVNEGRVNQYEHLRVLLAPLRAPLLLMPGNHDDRDHLRQVFPEHRELGAGGSKNPRCGFALNIGALHVIGLDTVIPGEPGGDLDEAQLQWLDTQLARKPDRPTLVMLHHPPFATGIRHMDACGLAPESAAALEQVIAAHPQVQRVSAGHVHRAISRRWAGTVASTVPSVAHAVALDLRRDGPPAWNYEPPSLTLHHWNGAALVTHQVACGDFPARKYESY